jgi:hypothetical protein
MGWDWVGSNGMNGLIGGIKGVVAAALSPSTYLQKSPVD